MSEYELHRLHERMARALEEIAWLQGMIAEPVRLTQDYDLTDSERQSIESELRARSAQIVLAVMERQKAPTRPHGWPPRELVEVAATAPSPFPPHGWPPRMAVGALGAELSPATDNLMREHVTSGTDESDQAPFPPHGGGG